MLLVATDHGSPSRTAAISKTVRVTGVNDNAPYFLDHVQNVTVVEGVAKRDIYRAHVRIHMSYSLCKLKFVYSNEGQFIK